MISNNDKISPYQLSLIIIMAVVGIGVFSLPASVAKTAGTDGWIFVFLGGIINLGFALIMVYIASLYPGKTFVDFSQDILGTFLGKLLSLVFAGAYLLLISMVLRAFTEVIKMFLLFRTPTEIIMLSLVLIATYLVRSGMECIARISEISFPILFIPFFLIIISGLKGIDWTNLLPFMQDFSSKILPTAPVILLSYGGFEGILYYIGFMKEPKKAYKPVIIAIVFITIFYTFITALCIANYGAKLTPKITWPLLLFVKAISLPDVFIERLDGIMLALWVLTVFTTIVTYYFIATFTVSKVIGTKEQKEFVLPISIILYYIALQPKDIAEMFNWLDKISLYIESIFIYVLPLVLLAFASNRRTKGAVK